MSIAPQALQGLLDELEASRASPKRAQEIRWHVKGAINNGVTKDELREVLMHSAIYCGIPAAVDGFRNASAVLAELGLE